MSKIIPLRERLALIFYDLKHFQGREQITRAELQATGIHYAEVDVAVEIGLLKRGVLGFFLPRPCDPGFLSVVDAVAMTSDLDRPWPDSAGLGTGDVDRAAAGPLVDRFGLDFDQD